MDAPQEKVIYTPSRLNREAKGLIENRFGVITLEGEISNFSKASSGHCYFSLKDDRAQINCAMFRGRASRLDALPRHGDQVTVTAEVSLYEARGNFQLIVRTLKPAGEGALQAEFEKLKKKLAAEGLFEADRKRSLPHYPQRIAVISSPTGAAFRDVLSVMRRRYRNVTVTLYPSAVQGDAAAGELRKRIESADTHGHDAILLTRGGGSLEDLWAFNDERLARAIADCKTPIVSAVGHEIDFTIADFVADLRAATPSAAAEALVPDSTQLSRTLVSQEQRLTRSMRSLLASLSQRLDGASRRLGTQSPAAQLQRWQRDLERLRTTVIRLTRQRTVTSVNLLTAARARLNAQSPKRAVETARRRASESRPRLERAIQRALDLHRTKLRSLTQRLETLGPDKTLQRGYAIVIDQDSGKVIRSVKNATADTRITTRVADGEFSSVVQ